MTDVNFLEDSRKAMLNILEDFAEERKTLDELNKRFDLATKTSHVAVWEWDIDRNILKANEEFYALYEAAPSDFVHALSGWFKFIHPDDAKKVKAELEKSIKEKTGFELVTRVILQNKKIKYIKTVSQFEKLGGSNLLVGIQMDVTKETEASRLKSEFISLASHQLRTPLTTISWYTELLLNNKQNDLLNPEQKEYLNEIYSGSKRMIKLVNSLLNISRIESGSYLVNPEPIDVGALVEKIIAEQDPKVQAKKLKILLKKGDLPTISLDVNLITIIIQNLITNAVKYSFDGGIIEIILSINEDGHMFTIEVKDYGIGISEEDKKNIFSRLFRTDQARKVDVEGSGLGLYLSRELVEKNGGKIWFNSQENKGTTFYVSLPLSGMVKNEGTKSVIL